MEQRTIKFRAFDKDSSEMMFSKELSGARDFYLDFNDKGLALWLQVEDSYPEKRDAVIMQFTGLLDKNGKEIYESDILTDQHGDKRPIEFKDGSFMLSYPDGQRYLPNQEYREVVGNIYQHLNLLK